jgi:hypothetical protein
MRSGLLAGLFVLPLSWLGCVQILDADQDYVLGHPFGGSGGTGGTADGGAGGTGGAGGIGGGGAGAGGMMCGEAVPPVGGACPAECNGGCDEDICVIDCSQTICSNTIDCPDDFACEVRCGSMDCRDATITCPPAHACEVLCTEGMACRDATLTCTDGPCSVSCAAGGCAGMGVTCGTNACTVDLCDSGNNPTLTCGDSCSCMDCG